MQGCPRSLGALNRIGASGPLLGLLGQAGVFVYQMDEASWIGWVGLFVSSAGTILLTGPMLWDTVLRPVLACHDAPLLDFGGPIYRTGTFMPFFVVSGLICSVGYGEECGMMAHFFLEAFKTARPRTGFFRWKSIYRPDECPSTEMFDEPSHGEYRATCEWWEYADAASRVSL